MFTNTHFIILNLGVTKVLNNLVDYKIVKIKLIKCFTNAYIFMNVLNTNKICIKKLYNFHFTTSNTFTSLFLLH